MSKPVSIYFATGSSTLDPNAKAALDSVVTLVKTASNAYIRVEGNTDNVGSAATNKPLSQRRAQAVADYLAQAAKVDKARFEVVGNGSDVPFDVKLTDSSGQRRVATPAISAAVAASPMSPSTRASRSIGSNAPERVMSRELATTL